MVRVVIENVGGRIWEKGVKTRVRYPSMNGGYITYTCISRECAEALVDRLGSWQRSRAKIFPAKRS